ncbi:MAG: ComEC/Rec2 family competence protein [Patescibacteria group bacterium]
MKKYFIVAVILIAVGVLFSLPTGSGKLQIYFFDVGQGDATLIKTPSGGTILIDGGPDRKILRQLGSALPFGKRTIDLVILSHPHADHVTGLVGVLERYKVKRVLATGVVHTTAEYLQWLAQIKEQNIPWLTAVAGKRISFADGVSLEILWPPDSLAEKKVDDLNESSGVVKLNYGSTSVLFTGDITASNEQQILINQTQVASQILKVPHQGSKTSSSIEFIKAVAPAWAVIFVGKNNRYGHPHAEVVARYQKQGIKTLRTDELGTIRFISDGKNWQYKKPWSLINLYNLL